MPAASTMYKGTTPEPVVNRSVKSMRDTKYRHVFATHSQSRMSNLTHGAETPSFVGFRNLMILVLGMHSAPPRHVDPSDNNSCFQFAFDD